MRRRPRGQRRTRPHVVSAKEASFESGRQAPGRATIIDRVARLLREQPWAAYDEQSADAITSWLDRLDVDTARRVRSYERGQKDRADVVQATERRIECG